MLGNRYEEEGTPPSLTFPSSASLNVAALINVNKVSLNCRRTDGVRYLFMKRALKSNDRRAPVLASDSFEPSVNN